MPALTYTPLDNENRYWYAVDGDGKELAYSSKPTRYQKDKMWLCVVPPSVDVDVYLLPKGIIRKLFGVTLTWEDEPLYI